MVNETEDTGVEPNVDIESNLDDFAAEFYGTAKAQPEPEPEEAEEEVVEEEVSETPEEEDSLETEPEEKPKKRNSAKERIDDLTAEKYEERRAKEAALARAAALERELETLKAGRQEKEEAQPLRDQLPEGAPNPDATDKDGNPLYELGEFDPKYIRDLTKFTIAEETKKADAERKQREWDEGVKAAQEELAENWATKVEAVETEIPTIRDDITTLTDTFENLDPAFGEYLAMTIMQSEVGPEIMHYFSQNIGEAQRIVAAGPSAAAFAIGRLDAMLSKPSTDANEQKRNKKVTEAAPPPEVGARGVNGRQTIRPDTDNLDAFAELFYEPLTKNK